MNSKIPALAALDELARLQAPAKMTDPPKVPQEYATCAACYGLPSTTMTRVTWTS